MLCSLYIRRRMTPNPSIDRTSLDRLGRLKDAAHVER